MEDYTHFSDLSPSVSAVAKKELGEDARIRDQALEEMRQWIKMTPSLQNCRTDANFLLRFLRHKKFHVGNAQDTLLRYITMRQEHSHWFHNTSTQDPLVLDLIDRGVAFALPQRDKHGRRVIFTAGGNIDPQKHKPEHVMKALMVCFESLLEDEENQVMGFSYLLDESGVTASHLASLWRPAELIKIWGTTEKGMPMRHRAIQFLRLPLLLSLVFSFAKSLMSSKLQKRIVIFKSDEDMRKAVGVDILPAEYGGKVPMKDMIEMFKEEIQSCQERLVALDQMRVYKEKDLLAKSKSSEKCGSVAKLASGIGLPGSFKKLEID